MRPLFCLCPPALATLLASSASAATLYVSPTGESTSGCTRAEPCSLSSAASSAVAGDTVVLLDGVYKESLYIANSGTSTDWITFRADDCATPIIEGPGDAPDSDTQDNGIGSDKAEYIRFQGLVSRGWNIGFGNGWAGGTDSDEVSNGHWEIENCISYSNGRTGFTFFSAEGFQLKHSIAAHNGSSTTHSWSSGVTLFEATGTNVLDGNISFENTDQERHTDGSGFIADEGSSNVTFINNIAFGNSGSCLRMTKSSGTKFINNTCYRNSQFGSQATGPTNPSELYFTNAGVTQQGVTFMNNVIVGTGQAPAGSQPVVNQPSSGWTNNVVSTGTPTFFTDAAGANPNFVPASGDTQLTGKGSTGSGVPTTDIGFDPKCLVKRTPVLVGSIATVSTWQYDIDIEYIKSIGGVAKCWNPATRSGTPDIGAYKAQAVTTVTPGTCVPSQDPGGTGNTDGGTGTADGGASVAADGGTSSGHAGGAPGTSDGGAARGGAGGNAGKAPTTGAGGGVSGAAGNGQSGNTTAGGAGKGDSAGKAGTAGASGKSGTVVSSGEAGSSGTTESGGSAGTAHKASGGGGGSADNDEDSAETPKSSGCGCRVSTDAGPSKSLAMLGMLGLVAAMRRLRRR